MMETERLSSSSDDVVEVKGDSYSALCEHNWERCEFCDKLFSNRYALVKHNVTHIIIPLIKQTTYQCDECLHHFTSIEDLAMHMASKHKSPDYAPVKLKFEDDIESFKEKIPVILQDIVTKQAIVTCRDELKDVFFKRSEMKRNRIKMLDDKIEYDSGETLNGLEETNEVDEWLSNVKHELFSPEIESASEECNKFSPKKEREASPESASVEKDSIRHRLLFEEDIEDDLFKDLSADCEVNIEALCEQVNPTFDKPMMPSSNQITNLDVPFINFSRRKEIITCDNSIRDFHEETTDLFRYGKAIHYDDLVEPERCVCRLCGEHFHNRFDLFKHEANHLGVTQKKWQSPLCRVCDRYIAGNYLSLKLHMAKKHPEILELDKKFKVQKCPKCGLKYYRYSKHVEIYHEIYKCLKCKQGFESMQNMDDHNCPFISNDFFSRNLSSENHIRDFQSLENSLKYYPSMKSDMSHSGSSVMQLCEMCFSFMKIYMQNRQNYVEIGEKFELGVRQTCDKCNNKFFEVKLVERKSRFFNSFMPRKGPMSNRERLKKMQNRLKMIQRINKC